MTQLYVGNLSEEGDEKNIRALFGRYGCVREVLMKNGYAFVEMESPIQADHVMRVLNGEPPPYICILGKLAVVVKFNKKQAIAMAAMSCFHAQ